MRKIYLVFLILVGFLNRGVSQTLSAGTVTDFGTVCVGNSAGPNSLSITGTNLTNQDITIASLSGYSFSTTSAGTYSNTLTISQTGGDYSGIIYIKFTPPSSGNFNGNLTISGGGAPSISVAVTGSGQANQTPTVGISASKTTICAGESVTFTATPTNGGTPGYQWYLNGNPVTLATSSTYTTATLNNNDQVYVVMTSSLQCVTGTATSNTIGIAVNPILTPSVSITSSATTICPGTNINFTANPVNGGGSPTYQWFVGGTPAGTGANFSSSAITDGQQVKVTMTSNATCASPTTADDVVSVNVKPGTPATPGAITGTSPVCPGTGSLTYSIAVVANADANGYQWTVPTGWTINSGQGSTSITVTAGSSAQTGNITVTASNSCGTSSASSKSITVSPGTPASPGSITGTTPVCPGTTQTYSIAPVSNADASGYTWTVPSGWSITNGQGSTSITVTAGSYGQNGNITVTASNSCGTSTASSKAVTISHGTPVTPGTITGTTPVCPGTTGTYSISAVTNVDANGYSWTVPTGWTITSGQGSTSITVKAGNYGQDGNITVTASNSCGTSSAATKAVSVSPGTPATPGIITGTTPVCPGTTGTYSISNVSNATGYTWTVPTGWSITGGQGTTSIIVTAGSYGQNGNITVTASNSCGTSSASTKAVAVSPGTPATPGAITGTTPVCVNSSNLSYSISSVSNATTYAWSVPSGWSITSGQGSTSVTVSTGGSAASGTISVTAGNTCGTSSASQLAVSVTTSVPATPPTIFGVVAICPTKSPTYSISDVAGATSYTWTVPSSGWTITSGQGTNTVNVNVTTGTSNDQISVKANNVCGSSAASILPVSVDATATVNAGPDQTVCAGTTSITLSGSLSGAVKNNNGNHEWYWETPGVGTIANTTDLNSTYSFPSGTTGTLTVKIKLDNTKVACNGSEDQMLINILSTPTASISAAGPVCSGSTSTVTFTATANTTVSYKVNGGTTQTINVGSSGSATLTTAPLTSNTTYSLVSVAYTSTPTCSNSSVSGSATIVVNPVVVTNAGSDQTVCSSSPAVTLSGSVSGGSTTGTWKGGTGTFAPNNTTLNAVYTPSSAEIAAGTVTLTLTGTDPAGPCGSTSDQMVITINPSVVTNAGADQTVCSSSPAVTLAGSVSGGSTTGTWSGGGGTFSPNNTTLNAVYTPSSAEIAAGHVTLTLTSADPAGPCGSTTDQVEITINPAVVTNAGTDQKDCASNPAVTLNGSVSGGSTTGTWSGGGGTFSPNNTTLNAVYTPSSAEIAAGHVTLTLTSADPAGPCGSTTDQVEITINPAVLTNAGTDQTVCASNPAVTLNGSVSGGATTGTWSGGTGTFSPNNTTLNAVYTPSTAEIAAGTVTLTLTSADPSGPCSSTSDQVTITINPVVTISAGSDQTICSNSTATMTGSFGGGASSATWSTSGSGSFSNNNPDAVYTPSAADIFNGTITLTYKSDDPSGPCTASGASMILTIQKEVKITTQPSNISVCESTPADLSVVASGSSLTYQWYKGTAPGGVAVVNSGSVSGAQTATLHFSSPAVSDGGSYYVVVSGTAECASVTSSAATLNVDKGITVTTQPVSQTLCVGSNVTFSVVADANGEALTYQWRKNGVNITGAQSSSYTINGISTGDAGDYDVVIGGQAGYMCSSAFSSKATLTVNDDATISLSSGNGTDGQTVCVNTALTSIKYAIGGGGNDASITSGGLPDGVTGTYSNGVFIISGTPTKAGNYSYTITATGPCKTATASGTITVNDDASISLSSAAGTDAQTVCINNSLTDITYTVGNGGTGATITTGALPDGVTGSYANGIFTITGTPTKAGNYSYTITATGPCKSATASGTITVNDDATIALSSAAGTDGQTLCINTNLTNITYAIGNGGTGASVTSGSLPGGVSGLYNNGVFTISGKPNKAGNYSYTITASGPCKIATISGTITVNDDATLSLSSGSSTKNQTVCVNNPITEITFAVGGGGTGATVTGLPSGVTGNYSSGTLTITGKPIVAGTFTYTVTTQGPCNNATATGTITVNDNSTIKLNSAAGTDNQTSCINTAITNITYGTGGGATGASVTGLPPGVSGSYASGVFTITGTPTKEGNYTYTVTTSGPCNNVQATGTIIVSALAVGGTTSPSLQQGCQNATGDISLSGITGSVTKWQYSTNGGATWTDIAGTSGTLSYHYSGLTVTTSYRAVVMNSPCTNPAYSTVSLVSVVPQMKPNPVTPTPRIICAGDTSVLSSGTGYPLTGISAGQGDFQNANPSGWRKDGKSTGNYLPAPGSNRGTNFSWLETTNTGGSINNTIGGIDYSSPDPKFAMVAGDTTSILETPVFSLIGQTTASLDFIQSYNFLSPAHGSIEISTDGGNSYSTVLASYTGQFGVSGNKGIMQSTSISLNSYLGLSNLRIRFKYVGTTNSAWAIDGLSTPGAALPISYNWSDTSTVNTILTPTNQTPITVKPSETTTYTITTYVNGCYAGSDTVTVFVNPLPKYGTVKQGPAVCDGSNATINLTGLDAGITSTIVYNIGGGSSQTVNVTADGSGNGSFQLPVVYGNNGQTLTITSITNASSANLVACSVAPNISTTLSVNPLPQAPTAGPAERCGPGNITISATPINSSDVVNWYDANSQGNQIATGTTSYNSSNLTSTTTYYAESVNTYGCVSTRTPVIATINPIATIDNQPSDQLLCPETASATFTVSANGSPSYTWEMSTDNGTSWNPVSSSDPDYNGQGTPTLTVSNIMSGNTKDGYLFRTDLAINNICPVTSNSGKLTIHNIWHGYTNTDWYTTSNWSDGALPTLSCDSVIILNVTKLPTVNGGGPDGTGAYTNHLVIRPGATVKVVDDTLHIAAGIWDNNMALDATQGTIDLNGNIDYVHGGLRPAQTIAGKMFNTRYNNNSGRIMNLQISNPKGVTVLARTENDTLNILHTLSFGNVNNVTLTTGDNITLISDANGTARLADLTNNTRNSGNNLSGQVEVERFIRTGNTSSGHLKAWEFVAIANQGQSIYDSWMEGGSTASTGYGTQISGAGSGTDMYSSQPSMKYLGAGDLMDWTGISSTANQIYNPEGYMVFVRGDRSVGPYVNTTPNPTRLRTKGTLLTYDKTINLAGITGFGSVGNPYAAAIDMRKVMPLRTTSTVGNSFYTWKSPAWGTYGYGVYVIYTQNDNGDYEPTPFGVGDAVNNNIESGQAFILQTVGGPASISFNETVKADAYSYNNTVFRGKSSKGVWQQLRTNLYSVASGGKTTIADGTLIHFDDKFSNKVDINDSRKIFNPGPSLSIREAGADLIVESRSMPSTDDTIYMRLTSAPAQNYRLVFAAQHLTSSGLQGYLEDHFLNTLTPINMEDTTVYDFAIVNSAASKASDRFDIVFKKAIVPPAGITIFTATAKGNDVITGWNVINEANVKQYEVEISEDGYEFAPKAIVPAGNTGTASYSWTDASVLPGYYYFRVKMTDQKGQVSYSAAVKVLIGSGKPSISVYPNPVTNGVIHLQFLNEPAGKYAIRLMNQLGQVIVSKQIERMDGSDSQPIQWNYNLAHGVYQIEITRPDGSVKLIKVIY